MPKKNKKFTKETTTLYEIISYPRFVKLVFKDRDLGLLKSD
ncbi:hypothetical protein LEP1GSC178_0930 [Leptospira licerasiae str. MMD4847]|uniref:Uncharacterized protein n=1 Tax=Leptospira licerasiae str. MMD4847 TaxID=1049971 RepID=A0ABN0H5H5_9LEPT|nr:hypothetical protein LEP1GSC178_0930 [Leptospira licerasiae str. MMD4847]